VAALLRVAVTRAPAGCLCVPQEVRQSFGNWASLTTRLYSGADHMEVEWTVGPIKKDDGLGREVVVRWSSNLSSGAWLVLCCAVLCCCCGCLAMLHCGLSCGHLYACEHVVVTCWLMGACTTWQAALQCAYTTCQNLYSLYSGHQAHCHNPSI
jgi:hypothetical protein